MVWIIGAGERLIMDNDENECLVLKDHESKKVLTRLSNVGYPSFKPLESWVI